MTVSPARPSVVMLQLPGHQAEFLLARPSVSYSLNLQPYSFLASYTCLFHLLCCRMISNTIFCPPYAARLFLHRMALSVRKDLAWGLTH
jgi:hypothetical protein